MYQKGIITTDAIKIASQTNNGDAQSLYNSALAYLGRGWSVIPVAGAAAEGRAAKLPPTGFRWKQYQNRFATQDEVREWFYSRGYKGLAILAGAHSRLAVLDCDNAEFAALLVKEAPHLANTYTVRTASKQLPHFYYLLPDGLAHTNTQRAAGKADFQARGAYVVAHPTAIGGKQYEIINDTTPYLLTKDDLELIFALMVVQATTVVQVAQKTRHASAEMLLSRYHKFLESMPRNASLHRAAVYAATRGWTEDEILDVLGKIFVGSPAPETHEPEREEDRWREARRTIRSAVKNHPFASSTSWALTDWNGLPNTVREKLLQLGDAHTPRLLDALLMENIEAGRVFSQKFATEVGAKYGIGRKNIIKSLNLSSIGDLFLLLSSSSSTSTQCTVLPQIPAQNSVRGRKEKQYIMPALQQVCDKLDVELRPGDELKPDDLKSPKAYRVALHRELVKRNSGMEITRRWLSKRLNVTKQTMSSYDTPAGVEARPVFEATNITRENLKLVPENRDGWPPNFYLLIAGKRRPLLRAAALAALNSGHSVKMVKQSANTYHSIKEEN